MGRKSKAERLLVTINKGLETYFGYKTFRHPQDKIVTRIMSGEDVLAILPTGAGKSLCFQLPAFLMPGVTIVITPIIALMTNQVGTINRKLKKKGITDVRAVYVNSELTNDEFRANLNPEDKTVKIVYVSPERLFTARFQEYVDSLDRISLVVVDEAHCASMWGYDFRTAYSRIPDFIKGLKERPVVAAFTATANEYIAGDIINMLNLRVDRPIRGNSRRDRLRFSVVDFGQATKEKSLAKLNEERRSRLLKDIRKREGELGIVYCSTIEHVNEVYGFLRENAIRAGKYHGQGTVQNNDGEAIDRDSIREFNEARKKILNQFIEESDDMHREKIDCMVATNAFGMGIDKEAGRGRDVTYVIHYNIPLNIENYYQEAGRGARWKETAGCDCILYFLKADIRINKYFIDKIGEGMSGEARGFLQRLARDRFGKVLDYVNFKGDRSRFLNDYFEKYVPAVQNNPLAVRWYKSLDGSFDTPTYFYANKSRIANILRQPGYELKGEIRRKNVETGSYYTEKYEIMTDSITWFDMMVLDTIYTMKRVGMKMFNTHNILQVMSGDVKADRKSPVRKDIAESIKKMQAVQLTIGKETGRLLPEMPVVNKKNSEFYYYIYHKDDTGYNKPLLFRHAEKTSKGMFVNYPVELLDIRVTSDKKTGGNRVFPITGEGLMIEHYLLYKVAYIIDAAYKINNSINFDFMIRDIGITFPDNRNGEYMKKTRMLEGIKKFMDRLVDYNFISGYKLRESKKAFADNGLAGYEGVEIYSQNINE